MARGNRSKRVGSLLHNDKRLNIPTAEMQSFFQREEDYSPLPPTHYPRQRPLAEGEQRERDPDRDPQLLWNGVRITLTPAQRQELAATGTIEIGDAQLVWRGKDTQDWSDLIAQTPPLYIQEKIHPKAIIDDLKRQAAATAEAKAETPDLFADFNGVPKDVAAEFYQHPAHWSNRMILGDSLAVMASLAERERLKGKVQCIYFDPPYGIRFNSNWQVSTRTRDVKDGRQTDISREPEQVKAFRDTWKDGIHSYLTYLRDRLTVARDLLTPSGSIFVQIGDENVHRVRTVMDEVFGAGNCISVITHQKTTGATSDFLGGTLDFILWYARTKESAKFRALFLTKEAGSEGATKYRKMIFPDGSTVSVDETGPQGAAGTGDLYTDDNLTSQSMGRQKGEGAASWFPVNFEGREYRPNIQSRWKTNEEGFRRLLAASRIEASKNIIRYIRKLEDFRAYGLNDLWRDIGGIQSRSDPKIYVVQTAAGAVQRCILMATDPGDLVLDPTCGSGTTAYVAEQWGRRWITIDTSRVALALARTRLMAARYQWYLLADSPEGRRKEAELTGKPPLDGATRSDLRQGFVYERVPHITLKSIANNSRIDDIWEKWQATLEPLRAALNAALGRTPAVIPGRGHAASPEPMNTAISEGAPTNAPQLPSSVLMGSRFRGNDEEEGRGNDEEEGRGSDDAGSNAAALGRTSSSLRGGEADEAISSGSPRRSAPRDDSQAPWQEWEIPREAGAGWPAAALADHAAWWQARIARQQEIDAAIAQAAEVELLYDRPYPDNGRVRVAGPFTVESLSPHRIAAADEHELVEDFEAAEGRRRRPSSGGTGRPQVDFSQIVIDYLKSAGIHQSDKSARSISRV